MPDRACVLDMEQTFPGRQPSRQIAPHYSSQLLFNNKSKDVLDGLSLAACNPNDGTENDSQTSLKQCQPDFETKLVFSEVNFCNACQAQLADREEQLLHYKSDWHRYNLHLRLRGAPPVSEDDFELIAGDVSSISGSDEEEDEDNRFEKAKSVQCNTPTQVEDTEENSSSKHRNSHKVFFRNNEGKLLSLHRCLLHHKKNPIYENDKLVEAAAGLPSKSKWAFFMVSCGHFAGAVFDRNEVLEHKTFHRYTVRKKRGSAQSSHDSKGSHAKSAGANLRRYNEAALVQEVQELLSKWKDLLNACHFVFVRIPVANRGMFFAGKNAPFQKDDDRIRIIPFPTRRPTFNELRRVQQLLASVECYGLEADIGTTMPRSPQRVFDKESGQLEVRYLTPDTKPQISPIKAKKESVKPKEVDKAPSQIDTVTAKEDVEVVDMDLVETFEELDLSHLKEFESSPRRKRNQKKDPVPKTIDFTLDEREIRWKNSLFTACKTGNENIYKTIIDEMTTHHSVNANVESKNASEPLSQSTNCTPIQSTTSKRQKSYEEMASERHTSDSNSTLKQGEASQLVQVVEFLNKPLGDGGQTLLHVASREGQAQMVLLLLEHGTDPALKDKMGKTPYNLGSADARNTFRRFMSNWPDRFDYTAAQIPSPLTEEMEAERKRKLAEKRKAKKKAANERNKDKKAAEALAREETKEKERFLMLSDREKRALAAERRILQQHNSEDSVKPILSRCYQCATDMTGKVPFEYSDYKFCSTKCLREHRSKK